MESELDHTEYLPGLSAELGWVSQPVSGEEWTLRPGAPAVCPVLSLPGLASFSWQPVCLPVDREGG